MTAHSTVFLSCDAHDCNERTEIMKGDADDLRAMLFFEWKTIEGLDFCPVHGANLRAYWCGSCGGTFVLFKDAEIKKCSICGEIHPALVVETGWDDLR